MKRSEIRKTHSEWDRFVAKAFNGIEYQIGRAAALHRGTSKRPVRPGESVLSLLKGARKSTRELRQTLGV